MGKVNIQDVIQDLASTQREKREAAIRQILVRRKEAAPELLKVLELVKAVPLGAPVALNDWSWFLAAYLLAQFGEKAALPILIEQFSMPPTHIERVFKDILTEDLPRLLATLAADNPAPLKGLVENRDIHESVRASALWGYTILGTTGSVPLGEATAYFSALFTGGLERTPSQVWPTLIASCAVVHALHLKEDILAAYHEELADPSAYPWKEVEREWSLDPERSLKLLAEESGGLIRDVWEEMEYWPWTEEAGQQAQEE